VHARVEGQKFGADVLVRERRAASADCDGFSPGIPAPRSCPVIK